jgi:hypothetical protein
MARAHHARRVVQRDAVRQLEGHSCGGIRAGRAHDELVEGRVGDPAGKVHLEEEQCAVF